MVHLAQIRQEGCGRLVLLVCCCVVQWSSAALSWCYACSLMRDSVVLLVQRSADPPPGVSGSVGIGFGLSLIPINFKFSTDTLSQRF